MERPKIFQTGIGQFQIPEIHGFDIVVTFVTQFDAAVFLPLTEKITVIIRFLAAADRTGQTVNPPLKTTIGAQGITLPSFSLQKVQGGQGTADGAMPLAQRFRIELSIKLFPARFDGRPD
ncbi:hypothetical protein MUP29_03185, partial [bacterium]|nr:hypothetical protein [bacterium]